MQNQIFETWTNTMKKWMWNREEWWIESMFPYFGKSDVERAFLLSRWLQSEFGDMTIAVILSSVPLQPMTWNKMYRLVNKANDLFY